MNRLDIFSNALVVMATSFAFNTAAFAQDVEDQIIVGSTETMNIETNLDGHPVPADIGQIYIGNTVDSADAITIDSGANFPSGIAFRRYLNEAASPTVVTAGTQLGYFDFRGYSGTQFWNAASFDVVVDSMVGFDDGELMPTKMRFAVSDGDRVYSAMELLSNGRLELGAVTDMGYYGPGLLGDPKLFVNTLANDWATTFAARPQAGAGYALRVHTLGETESDYLLGGSSGQDNGTFKFSVRGNGDVHVGGQLFVGGVSVIDILDNTRDQLEATTILANNAASAAAAAQSTANASATELNYFANNSTGAAATATGTDAAAIGGGASASGQRTIAFGAKASASGTGAMAMGADAVATSANAAAIGQRAIATGNNALALGNDARGNGVSAIAIGDGSVSSGSGTVAFGSKSVASATSAAAFGSAASAIRANATAVGNKALAQGVSATALGSSAVAIHDGATAVGANARTTGANQVALGGAGSSVRIGDIDASTAAQVGPVDVVTVDQNGTLGRQQVASAASVEQVNVRMASAFAVTEAQFAGLQGQVNTLFDLREHDRKDFKQGIAAALALANPAMPSAGGRTSYASNVSVYRGEVGFSAGVAHRLNTDNPFAITAAISHAGGKNTGARMGIAGEL